MVTLFLIHRTRTHTASCFGFWACHVTHEVTKSSGSSSRWIRRNLPYVPLPTLSDKDDIRNLSQTKDFPLPPNRFFTIPYLSN